VEPDLIIGEQKKSRDQVLEVLPLILCGGAGGRAFFSEQVEKKAEE